MNFCRLLPAILMFALCAPARGQGGESLTPEQRENKLAEAVDKELARLDKLLALEEWQEFYVDSTLAHDLQALDEALSQLRVRQVESLDTYQRVTDQWTQRMDDALRRILSPAQWEKYWKRGGKRAQQERDKRK